MNFPPKFAKTFKLCTTAKKLGPITHWYVDHEGIKNRFSKDPPKLLKFTKKEGEIIKKHWDMVEENWEKYSVY
jgi:hypothetical protein